MDINEARKLVCGSKVSCPADHGQEAYVGIVVTSAEYIAVAPERIDSVGNPFIWVEVRRANSSHKSVWPTNRLGQ